MHALAYFFAGAFLTNAIPHFVRGVCGQPFQSPFAHPPGEGLSSSKINVAWGFANAVMGYILLCRVGDFDPHATTDVISFGLGVLLFGLFTAHIFGRFHGGNNPLTQQGAQG